MQTASTTRIAAYKLEPPVPLPGQVERTGLLDRAFVSPTPRVVLVRSPAGFGKTTLLGQLAARLQAAGTPVIWLTLEPADNDAGRYVSCLAAATLPLLHDAAPPPSTTGLADDVAVAIFDALAQVADPFGLFLDEFEHLSDPAVLGLTRGLIARLPVQAQLYIGSRSVPELGLGALRARGRVLEFDADDLRFSIADTTRFLSARRGALPAADIATLHRRSEGWAAALWLFAAAMERHPDSDRLMAGLTGTQSALALYLAEDVLARLSPTLQHFLLRTSLLGTLSAPLCDAVLQRDDSAAQLEAVRAANLFLAAPEDGSAGYRFHGLFARFLRARLAEQAPAEIASLHDRASRWYESHGQVVPMIDHAIDSGDLDRSLMLLTRHAGGLIAEGRGGLLGRWFSKLPAHALRGRTLLQLLRAWAAMFATGVASARLLLAENPPDPGDDPALQSTLATLDSILLALSDRYESAWQVGQQPLARLPSGLDFADVALINNLALSLLCLGRKAEARALVDASRGHEGEGRSRFNAAVCEAVEGMIDLQEARLREATARLRMASRLTRPDDGLRPASGSFVGVPYSEALYESGDIESARRILFVVLPLACNSSMPDHIITAHLLLSRIEFATGDVDRAFELLNQLEILGHDRRLPRLAANARLERSRLYVLQRHLDAARIELDRCSADKVWQEPATDTAVAQDTEYPAIGVFRLALAEGAAAPLHASIDAELARALAARRTRRALKLRLMRSLAAFQAHDLDAAHDDLARLLHLSATEGFLQLLLDEGPLVGRLCRSFEASPGARHLPAVVVDHLQRVSRRFDPEPDELPLPATTIAGAAPVPTTPVPTTPVPTEPITARELRLLAAVADGYSNSAIADKLFISVHTVRGHLRSINAKLKVGSRTQAVAAARRLGLLR
ncbi:MAG: LuxR C-terminal-related transcriptional regulator [Burkholderiaceae bacterium]